MNATVDISSTLSPFNYSLIQDNIDELNEIFNLVLSVEAGVVASVAPVSRIATITINDNDGKLKYAINDIRYCIKTLNLRMYKNL